MNRSFVVFVGIVYAVIILCLGIDLAGASHGWALASFASFAGLVLIPCAAIGWASRRYWAGIAVLTIAGLCDLLLLVGSLGANSDFARSYAAMPLSLVGWVVLWLLWQVALLISLLRGISRT